VTAGTGRGTHKSFPGDLFARPKVRKSDRLIPLVACGKWRKKRKGQTQIEPTKQIRSTGSLDGPDSIEAAVVISQ
jgi:hypothetical protein